VADHSGFLERVVALLREEDIRYAVIGGVAVNAYTEPIVTQDLDLVVATSDLGRARALLEQEFRVQAFLHSLNVYDPDSRLQVQVQLGDGDESDRVVDGATARDVLDLMLPVAAPADLLRLKCAAAVDPARRASKRGKDLLDLARLCDAFPELWKDVPEALRSRVGDLRDT